jgi:hypothetical protein
MRKVKKPVNAAVFVQDADLNGYAIAQQGTE